MGNRTAKFISALFASVLAGAPLGALSQGAPGAADDCLSAPKGTAPQGQHWYYRLDRGSKRQCWYLRDTAAKAAQSVQPATTAPTTASAPPRSVQDAHAELTSPQVAAAAGTTLSIPKQGAAVARPVADERPNAATDGSAQQPAVASRWPDTSATPPSSAPQEAAVEDEPTVPATTASPSPAPLAPAAAEAPPEKATGTLRTLLFVIGGALTLAGITGSFIYRFAGSRGRARTEGARRRVNWDNRQPVREEGLAPWRDADGNFAPPVQRPRLRDVSAALPPTNRPRARPGQGQVEAIETYASGTQAAKMQPDATAMGSETASGEPAMPDAAATDPDADALDIDVITAILERLAKEGPRLNRPISEAGSEDFGQSRQGQSGVRA